MMKGGRVLEEGTYSDLLEKRGAFFTLVDHQLSIGKDKPGIKSTSNPPELFNPRSPPEFKEREGSVYSKDESFSVSYAESLHYDDGPSTLHMYTKTTSQRLWGYTQSHRYWFWGGSLSAFGVYVTLVSRLSPY